MQKFSLRKRLQSFGYAWKGMKRFIGQEHNAWIHLTAATLVVSGGLFFDITRGEWIAVILAIGLVIAAEAINTAIERLVDLVSPQQHPIAGEVKDIAAAAVLICAATAAMVGFIVFAPYIF